MKAGRTHGQTDSVITICLPKFLWGHKKGYINFVSKSVRPSVRAYVRPSRFLSPKPLEVATSNFVGE